MIATGIKIWLLQYFVAPVWSMRLSNISIRSGFAMISTRAFFVSLALLISLVSSYTLPPLPIESSAADWAITYPLEETITSNSRHYLTAAIESEAKVTRGRRGTRVELSINNLTAPTSWAAFTQSLFCAIAPDGRVTIWGNQTQR